MLESLSSQYKFQFIFTFLEAVLSQGNQGWQTKAATFVSFLAGHPKSLSFVLIPDRRTDQNHATSSGAAERVFVSLIART